MMWIEFELKDHEEVQWMAVFNTTKINTILLSKSRCSVMIDKYGDIKFANAETGLRCYQGFISAIQGNEVHMPEIGYIKPLKTPKDVYIENELNKRIDEQFERIGQLLTFDPAREAKDILDNLSTKSFAACCSVHAGGYEECE